MLLQKINRENSGGAERRREEKGCLSNLPETLNLESILAERCRHHQEESWIRQHMSQTRWLSRKHLETHLITIKPEAANHMADWFSWVPLPLLNEVFCFGCPCVSLGNSFLSVRQEFTLRSWKRSPFLQQRWTIQISSVPCMTSEQTDTSNKWLEKWEIKISPLSYWRNLVQKKNTAYNHR